MEPTEPFTVRTSKEIITEFDALARQADRSRNYLVNQALEEFLAVRKYQMEKIKAGIKAADKGELVPHEQVFAELRAKRPS